MRVEGRAFAARTVPDDESGAVTRVGTRLLLARSRRCAQWQPASRLKRCSRWLAARRRDMAVLALRSARALRRARLARCVRLRGAPVSRV